MRKIKREKYTPYFVPDYIATSVTDIDFEALKKAGVKYLAFDADSTLMEYRGKVIADTTINYLEEQKPLFDGICIATNRVLKDLDPVADSIGADLIQAKRLARKPKKKFFKRVLEQYKALPEEIAMIGDKLVADMYGAKRMGFVTVWVARMGERDSVWDRALHVRDFEQRMMDKYLRTADV